MLGSAALVAPSIASARCYVRTLSYPDTRRDATRDTLHGVGVEDPYRWLENREAPDVERWITAQDSVSREYLSRLPDRIAMAARLRELYYVEKTSLPRSRGGRLFYTRHHADREKAILYWRDTARGEEHILLDPNDWSKDGSLALKEWSASWDGRHLAYSVGLHNADNATLHVMDVGSRAVSAVDVIEGARYATPSWTPGGDGFYYTWIPMDSTIQDAERPGRSEIRFHRVGDDPARDRVIRPAMGDPTRFQEADLSRSGRWLLLTVSYGWTSSEVYFAEVHDGVPGPFVPLITGTGATYEVQEHDDRFYVRTNEGAPHWRLFEVEPQRPERSNWKEIIREHRNAVLAGVSVLGRRLAITYLEDASSRLEIRDLRGRIEHRIPLPTIGTILGPEGEEDRDEAFFLFRSFTVPDEIYSLSMPSGTKTLWFKPDLPIDPGKIEIERVFAKSKDGTRVPLFIVRGRNTPRDGSAPAILYGYGGFRVSQTPAFRASMYPWIENGGIYVVAVLRGGEEFGEEWHRAGMGRNKQNVFDDYIAAAEYLITRLFTSASRLVAYGGSNGGLLVAAALTQRPELFRAVICSAPLTDMLRYHKVQAGATWISEYGSPDDPEYFPALRAYSPYHNIQAETCYPSVIIPSPDRDDRVDPMHARKFAAALQVASTGGPVLLRVDREAAHGGADLVKKTVEWIADAYSFALSECRR